MERVVGEWADRTGRDVRLIAVEGWRVDTRAGTGDDPVARGLVHDTEAAARAVAERTMAESGDQWRDLTEVTGR